MAREEEYKQQFSYEKYLLKDENNVELCRFDNKQEAKKKFIELSTGDKKITCEKIYPDYKNYQIVHEEFNLL